MESILYKILVPKKPKEFPSLKLNLSSLLICVTNIFCLSIGSSHILKNSTCFKYSLGISIKDILIKGQPKTKVSSVIL